MVTIKGRERKPGGDNFVQSVEVGLQNIKIWIHPEYKGRSLIMFFILKILKLGIYEETGKWELLRLKLILI